jgi:hypothetical protein
MEKVDLRRRVVEAIVACIDGWSEENVDDGMKFIDEITRDGLDVVAVLLELENLLGINLAQKGFSTQRVANMAVGELVDELAKFL